MRSFAVSLVLSLVVIPIGCRAGLEGAGAAELDTDGGRGSPDGASTPADPREGGVPGDIGATDGSLAPDSGAAEAGRPDRRDSGVTDAHSPVAADGGGNAGDASTGDSTSTGLPGTFQVFSQIPQFGIYATSDPKGYSPPPGVLMWEHGTAFATKLTEAQQARIGADLAARITYHAQCDNYDRIGGLFFIVMPHGQLPTADASRTELTRFITPFSDYRRGSLATYVFPDADISPYARALADRTNDVWIGVFGGSNPYDGDPCTNAGLSPEFRAVGFKYSVDFISTRSLPSATASFQTASFYESVKKIPFTSTFMNPGGEVSGRVTVIVSGHGANAGGAEYRNTQDTVTVNGKQVGAFSTRIDCASYEKFSPDGNPGIFRNNNSGNPRNWCPGALVPSHSFDATLKPGSNTVSLGISPSDVPSGSFYATSLNFTAR
jgi:hypothetical protein